MEKLRPIRVAVTGAAGQIGYSLLFHLARGQAFGHRPIELHLLEIPEVQKSLEGVVMELEDGAFSSLKQVKTFSSPQEAFDGADWVLMVGSKPRGPGMERKDLLKANGPIFVEQGKALLKANQDVRVVVVGNPCHTNALIAMSNAKEIPRHQFSAMMALDENRTRSLLAHHGKVSLHEVEDIILWGNHSSTMFPDVSHARIKGKSVKSLPENFVSQIRERGAAVIAARGKSSAASAASSCIDHICRFTSRKDSWFSAGVDSHENPYGIESGLIYSFPIRSISHEGHWSFVENLEIDDRVKEALKKAEKELLQEKQQVLDWL